MSLDTEESWGFSNSKPVTPWGKQAKKFAQAFFKGAEQVTIEFPGTESVSVCLDKYRGNFGRLLVWAYRDGVDFQQVMIRKGYSPYYMKYGFAEFSKHHQRYMQAERLAQIENLGVWDQVGVNGTVVRNYPQLQTWWLLRASIIDVYRRFRAVDDTLYNTRKDYATLLELAKDETAVTVFTEIREIKRSGNGAVAGIGSDAKPFEIFIPEAAGGPGRRVVQLLKERYISVGERLPKRSYCFMTGKLTFAGTVPRLVIPGVWGVTDGVEGRAEALAAAEMYVEGTDILPDESEEVDQAMDGAADVGAEEADTAPGVGVGAVKIVGLVPDPSGEDFGKESVVVKGTGTGVVRVAGWKLQDASGRSYVLDGEVGGGQERSVTVTSGGFSLNNGGDTVKILDLAGKIVHEVSYTAADVVAGGTIRFE